MVDSNSYLQLVNFDSGKRRHYPGVEVVEVVEQVEQVDQQVECPSHKEQLAVNCEFCAIMGYPMTLALDQDDQQNVGTQRQITVAPRMIMNDNHCC